jgi:integrase
MTGTITPSGIATAGRQAAASGQRITVNDPLTAGLCLRITPRGVRTWSWVGRDADGRVRRFALGRHPHIGLAEARRLARKMSYEAPRGVDPIAAARARRAKAQAPARTLDGLLRDFCRQKEDKKSWATQMAPQIRRVFREHLETPAAALTVGDLQRTVDGHPKPKSASFGVRCLITVLRWATQASRAYVDHSLLELRATAPHPKRERVVAPEELAAVLPVLRASADPYARAHMFILLTLARREEVVRARWRHIDFAALQWTLPKTKTQQEGGPPHIIPLSRQAVALLRSMQPAAAADPDALIFTTANGKALNDWDTATDRLQAASGTDGWHRHDLRRTSATMMGQLGVMPAIVESALNHRDIHSKMGGIYNKWRYLPEVADGLQRLADRMDVIAQGGADVVAFPAASAGIVAGD